MSIFDAEAFNAGCVCRTIKSVAAGLSLAFISFAATKEFYRASAVNTPTRTTFAAAEAVEPRWAFILVAAFGNASAGIADGIVRAMGVGSTSGARSAGKGSIANLSVRGLWAVGVGDALALRAAGEGVFISVRAVRIVTVRTLVVGWWWSLAFISRIVVGRIVIGIVG